MLTVIETPFFSRQVSDYWTEDERGEFAAWIAKHPTMGDVIPGSSGVRKVRWSSPGKGKRGGVRVIYFNRLTNGEIWLLLIYDKSARETMPKTEKRILERDAQRDIGTELLQSIREMKADRRSREYRIEIPSVTEARQKVGLTQSQFADLLGVSRRTLQDWEQGRRQPSGAARTLLRIAMQRPEVLRELAS